MLDFLKKANKRYLLFYFNSMKNTSYAQAGVDIQKGDDFVEEIKKISKSKEIGLFGAVFDIAKLNMKNPVLVSGTDGVGTKLKLAYKLKKHDTIGVDLVAMCVNDVLCHGAKPVFFLDYLGTSKLNLEIGKAIIQGIVEGCRLAGCELVGGETAEMPGIYKGEEYDLAGFCVGAVERENLLPRIQNVKKGDIIIGLPSSGVHSNGFSMINYILETVNVADEILHSFLKPTKIYVSEILNLLEKMPQISALAHITGGGLYDNIMRVVPEGMNAEIDFESFERPEIFNWISKNGDVSEAEMRKVFNLGIGFTFIVPEELAEIALSHCVGGKKIGKIA
jgi:phosphoribosylaminoimidazole synthetase